MPHSSKKYRRQAAAAQSSGSKMTTYAVVAIIAVVIAAAAGWYVYNNYLGTTATSTTTVNSSIIYAKIGTTFGTIEVELFASQTPKTVSNFVNLSESGFYNNLVWHRIVAGFVIQTGDPNTRNGGGNRATWGQGGSPKTVPLEIVPSLHNDYGYLGMARSSDPNSGSSQFYINLANNTNLDGSYTVFGKVISGMNYALEIGNVPVNSTNDQPLTLVYMTNVTILSSGP
jgi:dolichyl-diphosphooligosaccharide--protein glycosyltransferase